MEDQAPVDPDRKPGRRGLTLADLMALTLGVAVATALAWYSGTAASSRVGGRPAPGWYVAGNRTIEVCQKTCIALSVVILFRNWRLGGTLRPAEALPMFEGLPPAMFSLSKWHVFGIYYLDDPSRPWNVSVNLEALHLWMMAQVALGFLALVLVAARRRHLPGWAAGVLIVVAYNRLTEPLEHFFRKWANPQFESLDLSPVASLLAYSALVEIPIAVLGYLPIVAAAVDFGRRDRPRRSWSEWSGMLLGMTIYLLVRARYFAQYWLSPTPSGPPTEILVIDAIAFGIGVLLVWRFGPRLRRSFGPVGNGPRSRD